MSITDKQRTVISRMDDGEWYLGESLSPNAPGVLGVLARKKMIRDDMQDQPFASRNWTITPDGLAALEAAQ
jgi:hypothetical protein